MMLQSGSRIHSPSLLYLFENVHVSCKRKSIAVRMSDSDISFETDDEGNYGEYHKNTVSSFPSRWSDINTDDIEISARNIFSCVSSNGLLSTLEQRPSNSQSPTYLEVCFLASSGDYP